MPDLLRLLGHGGDERRMRVSERIDGDAGREIEVTRAVGRGQPGALAPLEGKVGTRIRWQ